LDATSERWSDTTGGGASSARIPLDHRSLLGSLDMAFRSGFKYQADLLYGGGQTSGGQTPASADPASGLQRLIQGGTHRNVPFSPARGDPLDLRPILQRAPVVQDLTNIERFVKLPGRGPNDPSLGHGTQAAPQISRLPDQAIVHPQGSARADLQDLVKHDDLIPPSS
jgi:hypothetical protein